MEIARVLGSLVKSGWRPRRTIIFASWAVEEYGSEGSYEYVYENINKIMERYNSIVEQYTDMDLLFNCFMLICLLCRAVATINMDTCVAGPILVPKASPVMKVIL
jgi:N-acetylated-alpha-linked acidic dipeptidase